MRIKVLVVEDNVSLNKSIINMLEKEKYTAFGVQDMDQAREMYVKEKPHIILLDIMLPQGRGYELIKFFLKDHDSRIIMLTALDDRESKRICYENGADDYITKPFDLHELLYKLNAIKKRILTSSPEFNIGDISFNTENNKLSCGSKTIVIQPSQIRFLKLLYEKHLENSFVDKAEGFEGSSSDLNEASRLQTLVARLRKNLSYIGSGQIDIETIYGKGYRIIIKNNRRKQYK